jgi:hypothetical protein
VSNALQLVGADTESYERVTMVTTGLAAAGSIAHRSGEGRYKGNRVQILKITIMHLLESLGLLLRLYTFMMLYNSASIATGYGLEGPGSILNKGKFFLLHNVWTGSECYSTSY